MFLINYDFSYWSNITFRKGWFLIFDTIFSTISIENFQIELDLIILHIEKKCSLKYAALMQLNRIWSAIKNRSKRTWKLTDVKRPLITMYNNEINSRFRYGTRKPWKFPFCWRKCIIHLRAITALFYCTCKHCIVVLIMFVLFVLRSVLTCITYK